MSDGNYNRNLLPYNNYQSGLKAGRAQMQALAFRTFDQWIETNFPEIEEGRRMAWRNEFRGKLGK